MSLWIAAAMLAILAAGQTQRDLKYEPPTQRAQTTGRTWALVVGVSSYKNAPPQAQLKFAHRDAEQFARFLKSSAAGSLPATQVRVLTDSAATVSAIRAALHDWLPAVAGPTDLVYVFFAGHGVVDTASAAYFVAHDSDPQNLHATGLSFAEVNETISQLKAGVVILLADACHAGGIGWSNSGAPATLTHQALEALGRKDQSLLKLLASRPSEQSYEDARWDGGHGVFTYAVLSGLRGSAEQEPDGVVRVSELIDYLSRVIPQETAKLQNPRVAGNFEPRFALARLPETASRPATAALVDLDLTGPPGAAVYLDGAFRGTIRRAGDLRLDRVSAGPHRLEVELPDRRSFEQTVTVAHQPKPLNLNDLPGFAILHLESMIQAGNVLTPGGAWDYFRSRTFPPEHRTLATSLLSGALEDLGQQCVNDYVQSTTSGLKAGMLRSAADAYARLQQLRPNDRAIGAKRAFCQGRASIAAGAPDSALASLRESLRIDPEFACAHNALGVALERLNRPDEARAAFDRAFQLAPEWFLPPLQLAQQLMAANQTKRAIPLLEKAVRFNPRAPLPHWLLLRAYRTSRSDAAFAELSTKTTAQFPNYAPAYLELAAFHDARGDFPKAVAAYDAYLTLAPNFEDSAAVRSRLRTIRPVATQKPPSLMRPKLP